MKKNTREIMDSLTAKGADHETALEITSNIKILAFITKTPMEEIVSYDDDGYVFIHRRPHGETPSNGEICVYKSKSICFYVRHVFGSEAQEITWANYINQ